MNNPKAISPRVIISLGLLYLIWGSTFLSVRILLDYLPPLVITYSRNFTAGLLLLIWSVWTSHGADAFRMLSIAWRDETEIERQNQPIKGIFVGQTEVSLEELWRSTPKTNYQRY